jgi:HK97 family phage major capsid protein
VDDSCIHGYIPESCADCRVIDGIHADIEGLDLAGLRARRAEVTDRMAVLSGYAERGTHLTGGQRDELERLAVEQSVLGGRIDAKEVIERRDKLEHIKRVAQDPRNREGGDAGGAPGFVADMRAGRLESAQQVIARAGDPWRHEDTSGAGYVARAHTALEALSDRLGPAGAELLAQAITERLTLPGITVKRSRDETADAAALILALSNPHYESAMRSVFRNPDMFAAGVGHMVWSDEERQAVHDVMGNTLARAAFSEGSGAAGAYALPLQLDSSIVLVNSGVVGPFRKLARPVIGTTNVWEGITSQGVTSSWVAEAGVVPDATPTLGQLAITPLKQASWAFGSFEVMDDTELAAQLPMLFADGKTRLENTAFAIGTGTTQPWGVVAAAAADAGTGVLTNTMVYGLHGNLPPRFRAGDTARPAWISNVSMLNAARQLVPGSGMTTSIVNDNTADGIPEMLGIDFYEASAMVGGATGNRELALADFSQFIVVDRIPNVVLAEPLVKDQATQRPTGQRGWLQYSRVGSDLTTRGAAYGSNAAVVHVH